jgi:hypothetical protein
LLYLIDFISNLWTFCVAERTVAGDPVGIEQPSNVLKLHPMSPAQLGRIDDEDSGASMTRRVRLGTIECLHFHTGAQQRTCACGQMHFANPASGKTTDKDKRTARSHRVISP